MAERYADIIMRLEELDGRDREVDEAIMGCFYVREKRHIGGWQEDENGRDQPYLDDVWIDPSTDRWSSTHAKEFTASLDAAVGLVEKCLPGWQCGVEIRRAPNGGNTAWVAPNEDSSRTKSAATPAIALLLALFRALQDKEGKHG